MSGMRDAEKAWDDIVPEDGWAVLTARKQGDDGMGDSFPKGMSDEAIELRALMLLRTLDGLPLTHARRVLRQAESWMDAITALDCGSGEFRRAIEAVRLAAGEEG
jgi:hypothetical protein